MENNKKQALYESIMKDVAPIVKKAINETNSDEPNDIQYKLPTNIKLGLIEFLKDHLTIQIDADVDPWSPHCTKIEVSLMLDNTVISSSEDNIYI